VNSSKQLEGPLRNETQITEQCGGGRRLEPDLAEFSKNRLQKYAGQEALEYKSEEGFVEGLEVFR